MKRRTLGQVAHDAFHGGEGEWIPCYEFISKDNKYMWDAAAAAVAREVRRRDAAKRRRTK